MDKFREEINRAIKKPVDEGAARSIDPNLGVPEDRAPIKYEPIKLYKPQEIDGGLAPNDILDEYKVEPQDPYSEAADIPKKYSIYETDYNRKQKMQADYDRIMGIEDNEEREINYKMFLMQNYGYDILAAKGHDVTSSTYWYKKFKQMDFSNPVYNDYIMDSAIYEAEFMFEQYNTYKLNHDFDSDTMIANIAEMYNQDITEEMYPEIQLHTEIQDLDFETFMKQLTSGMLGGQERAVYQDDEIVGFMHEDGKMYEVMTEAEYKEKDPGYDVFVLQKDGDLILNDKTGVGAAVGNLGRGLVRSVYDLAQLIYTGWGGVKTLLNQDQKFGDGLLKYYQQSEKFANEFDFIGKDTLINMDGSKKLWQNETWYGVAGFVGQIAGAIAISFLTAGATSVGSALAATGKKSGQEVIEQTTKATAKEVMETSLKKAGELTLVKELGEDLTKETLELAVKKTIRETAEEAVTQMGAALGKTLVNEMGEEAVENISRQVMSEVLQGVTIKELKEETVQTVLIKYSKEIIQEQTERMIKKTIIDESIEKSLVSLSDDLAKAVAKKSRLSVSEVDDFVDDILKKMFSSSKYLDSLDDTTLLKKTIRNKINYRLSTGADDALVKLADDLKIVFKEQSGLSLNQFTKDTVQEGLTRTLVQTSKRTLAKNWVTRMTGRGLKMTGATVGRIHGIYMGNPLGSEVSMTLSSILVKRGAFAVTYAMRDGITTYTQLRTLGVDEEQARKDALRTFGINTAVTFIFTGGIDDSVTSDWYKVLNAGGWTKKVPAEWTKGELGRLAFRKLLFVDVASDGLENFVTMGTDAYFKNPDREQSFSGWLKSLGELASDPELLLSVGAMTAMGAVGARRSHQAGIDLPAKGFDKLNQEFNSRATDMSKTSAERQVWAEVNNKLNKKFKHYLDNGDASGAAMIKAMEDIHKKLEVDHNSIVLEIMNKTATNERIAMQKVLYNQATHTLNKIKANNMNVFGEVLNYGFPSALKNMVQKMKVKGGDTAISLKRVEKALRFATSVSDNYRFVIDDDDLGNKLISEIFDREPINFNAEELKNSDIASEVKSNIKIEIPDDKTTPAMLKAGIPESDLAGYNIIRMAYKSMTPSPVFKSMQHSLNLMASVYHTMTNGINPVLVKLDDNTYAVRADMSNLNAILAVQEIHSVARALTILHRSDMSMRSRTKALKILSQHMNSALPRGYRQTTKVLLHTMNDLVYRGYISEDIAVEILREIEPNYKKYNESTNSLVKYVRLVGVMENIGALKPGDKRRVALEGQAMYLIKELQASLPPTQSKALESKITRFVRDSRIEPTERIARSKSQPSIDNILKILNLESEEKLTNAEATEVLKIVWDDYYNMDMDLLKLKARATSPEDLVRHLENSGYLTVKQTRDILSTLQKNSSKSISIKVKAFESTPKYLQAKIDNNIKLLEYILKDTGLGDQAMYEMKFNTIKDELSKLSKVSPKSTVKIFRLFDELISNLANQAEKYTGDDDLPHYRDVRLSTGQTLNVYLDIMLRQFDEDYRLQYSTDLKTEAIKTHGYLKQDLRIFENPGNENKKIALLENYYWNEVNQGRTLKSVLDNPDEGVEHAIKLVYEVENIPNLNERIQSAFEEASAFIEPLNMDEKFNALVKAKNKVDNYFTTGVTYAKNAGTRYVIDLNRIVPKAIKQIADVISLDTGSLMATLRSTDKDSAAGLINALKERSDVDSALSYALVEQHLAYQRLLNEYVPQSGILVFDDFAGNNSYNDMNNIMRSLGYQPEDYNVDSQVINIPGLVKLGEDVPVIMGTVTSVPGRYGVKEIESQDIRYFNRSFFRDTQGIQYFDRTTTINPGLLARIGNNIDFTRRTIASLTNRRFKIKDSKGQKSASKTADIMTDTQRATGFAFEYDDNIHQYETVLQLIEAFDEVKPLSMIPTDTIPDHRFTFTDGGKVYEIWHTHDFTQIIPGENITSVGAFNKDAADVYIQKQIRLAAIEPSTQLDLSMLVPPTLQAIGEHKMDSYIKYAKSSLHMDDFSDTVINNSSRSIQSVISEFSNEYDPTVMWKNNIGKHQYEIFSGKMDTKGLVLDDEGLNPAEIKGLTIEQIIKRYSKAKPGTVRHQLFNYASAALAKSDEVYADFDKAGFNSAVKMFLGHEGLRAEYEAQRNKMNDTELMHHLNTYLRNEAAEDNKLEIKDTVRKPMDRTLIDPSAPNERVLTGDYINNLNPVYSHRLTVKDIATIRKIDDDLAKGKKYDGSIDPLYIPKSLEIDNTTQSYKQSKVLSFIQAMDQDPDTKDVRIPLALVETLTKEDFEDIKDSKILDKKTLALIASKMKILDEFRPEEPEGIKQLRAYRTGARNTAVEVRNQTIGDAAVIREMVMNNEKLKEFNSWKRNDQKGGFEKVRKLFDDYLDKDAYGRAYLNYISDDVLHTLDKPHSYLAINENNRLMVAKRTSTIVDIAQILKENSPSADIKAIAKTANAIYAQSTGVRYQGEYTKFALVDKTGKMTDSAKYVRSNINNEAGSLYAMLLSKKLTPENADTIYILEKDAFISQGKPMMKAIKLFDQLGKPTKEFNILKEHATADLAKYLLNYRENIDEEGTLSNVYRKWLGMSDKDRADIDPFQKEQLELAVMSYITVKQGVTKTWQDNLTYVAANIFGTHEEGQKITKQLINLIHGNKQTLKFNIGEFDNETQAILNTVNLSTLRADLDNVYKLKLESNTRLQAISDLVLFGHDADSLEFESLHQLRQTQIRLSKDSYNKLYLNTGLNARPGEDVRQNKIFFRNKMKLKVNVNKYVSTLLAMESNEFSKIPTLTKEKHKIINNLNKTLKLLVLTSPDKSVDMYTLRHELTEHIFKQYLSRSTKAQSVRFFTDKSMTLKSLHDSLTTTQDIEVFDGKTITQLLKPGTEHTSFDVESVPFGDKQLIFQVGFIHGKFNNNFDIDLTDKKNFYTYNDELYKLYTANDPRVMSFINERKGTAWHASFVKWLNSKDKVQWDEVDKYILNKKTLSLISANGKEFDVVHLANYLSNEAFHAIADPEHIDITNDLKGMMDMTSNATNIRLDEYVSTDSNLKATIDAAYTKLTKNKIDTKSQSHDAVYDSIASMYVVRDVMLKGLKINESRAGVRKPLLNIEEDFLPSDSKLSVNDISRISDDLSEYQYDDDGVLKTGGGIEDIAVIASIMNSIKKNKDINQRTKFARIDMANNLPTYFTDSNFTKIKAGEWKNFYKLMDVIAPYLESSNIDNQVAVLKDQFYKTFIDYYNENKLPEGQYKRNTIYFNEFVALALDDTTYNNRFFELLNKNMGIKLSEDPTVSAEAKFASLTDVDVNHSIMEKVFNNLFNDVTESNSRKLMDINTYSGLVSPIAKLASILDINANKSINGLLSPFNRNLDNPKNVNPDGTLAHINKQARMNVTKVAIDKTLDHIIRKGQTTMRKGIKVNNTGYKLAISSNKVINDYSDFVGFETSQPIPGDIVISAKTFKSLYGANYTAANKVGYLGILRQPSDRPDSFTVVRYYVTNDKYIRMSKSSLLIHPNTIKMLQGDFDGDHIVTFGVTNPMYPMMAAVHKAQHYSSPIITKAIDDHVKKYGKVYNKISESIKEDVLEILDVNHPLNQERIDYYKLGLEEGFGDPLKDNDYYKNVIESVVNLVDEFDLGELSYIQGLGIKSQKISLYKAATNIKQQRIYQAYLANYQQLFAMNATEVASQTGWMQMQSLVGRVNDELIDLGNKPVSKLGVRETAIDDVERQRWTSIYDASDDLTKTQMILDFMDVIETEAAVKGYTDTLGNIDFNLDHTATGNQVIDRMMFYINGYLEVGHRYSDEMNKAFKDAITPEEVKGLANEVFVAKEIKEALQDSFSDYFTTREEVVTAAKASSSFRKTTLDNITQTILSNLADFNKNSEEQSFDMRYTFSNGSKKATGKKARIKFVSKHLSENTVILSNEFAARSAKLTTVKAMKIPNIRNDIHVGSKISEGDIIGFNNESAPFNGKIIAIDKDIVLFQSSTPLTQAVKLGQDKGASLYKMTIGGIDEILDADIYMSMNDLGNIAKLYPREAANFIDVVSDSKELVIDVDLQVLEAFLYSKNKNENTDVNEFGGQVEGGSIDLLTSIMNAKGISSSLLFGNRVYDNTGVTLKYKAGEIPFSEYVKSFHTDWLPRNVIPDLHATRLLLIEALATDEQFKKFSSVSRQEWRTYWDNTVVTGMDDINSVEKWIAKQLGFKGQDFRELVNDRLIQKIKTSESDKSLLSKLDYYRRLLDPNIVNLGRNKIVDELVPIKDIPYTASRNIRPANIKDVKAFGQIFTDASIDEMIKTNKYDLTGRNFLSWRDFIQYLIQDSSTGLRYIPSDNYLMRATMAGYLPYGKGKEGALATGFQPSNEEFILDIDKYPTTGGGAIGTKTGTEVVNGLTKETASNVAVPVEDFKSQFNHISNQRNTIPNPTPQGKLDTAAQIRLFMRSLFRSVESDPMHLENKTDFKLNQGKLREEMNRLGQTNFEETLPIIGMKAVYENGKLGYRATQDEATIRPSDVSDLSKKAYSSLDYNIQRERVRSEDAILEAYNKVTALDEGTLTALFAKINNDKKQVMDIKPFDVSEFNKNIDEVRDLLTLTLMEQRLDSLDDPNIPLVSRDVLEDMTHKTLSFPIDTGQKYKDLVLTKNFLTVSGISDKTFQGAEVNNMIKQYQVDFHRVFDDLAREMLTLKHVVNKLGGLEKYHQYNVFKHLINMTKQTGDLNNEAIQRYAGDLVGFTNTKDIMNVMLAYTEAYEKGSTGVIVKMMDNITEAVYNKLAEEIYVPTDFKYMIKNPLTFKNLGTQSKQSAYISLISSMFDPTKYGIDTTIKAGGLIEDPFDALATLIKDTSKIISLRHLDENSTKLGLKESASVIQISKDYINLYMDNNDIIKKDTAIKAVLALLDDPHVGKYLLPFKDDIFTGKGKELPVSAGRNIINNLMYSVENIESELKNKIRAAMTMTEPKYLRLLHAADIKSLTALYGKTSDAILKQQILDLMNILKVKDEVVGFAFGHLKDQAPSFSQFLQSKIGDSAITDRYMRIIGYNTDSGMPSMKPVFEQDSRYIYDMLHQGYGAGKSGFEQRLLSMALNGEIFESHRQLTSHLDKHFFTIKAPNAFKKALKTTGLWFNKFVMGNPLRLPERLFRFASFDIAMLTIQNPKTLFYLGKAAKHMRQSYQTKEKVRAPELVEFYKYKGVTPVSAKVFDYIGRTEEVSTLPGIAGRVQEGGLEAIEEWSDTARYANFLANLADIRAGKISYGAAYKKKAFIDGLPDEYAKASMIYQTNLPTMGDLPLISRKMAPYFVFTSFGLGLTRTGLDWASSARRVIESAIIQGDTSGVVRNLLIPGMGIMGVYLATNLYLELVGELFGVDEDEVDSWKKEQSFIDPFATMVFGSPATRMTSNPIKNITNDWIRPLTEGYKGLDKYDKTDDSWIWSAVALLNTQLGSKVTPLIKTPVELITNHDMFGTLPIPVKYQYTLWDNVARKLSGIILGTSAGNSLINNLNMTKYKDDPWVIDIMNSMSSALGDEFGNSRTYKQSIKDFYKARSILYGELYRSDKDVKDNLSDLFNTNYTDQFSDSKYDPDEAKRVGNLLRQVLKAEEDVSIIYKIIYNELEKGTAPSILRSALNKVSVKRLYDRLDDPEKFKDSLSKGDWKALTNALEFEDRLFPGLGDMLPYKSYSSNYSPFNYKIPYNKYTWLPKKYHNFSEYRTPYKNNYQHWTKNIQPNMGTDRPVYVAPDTDPNLGTGDEY